MSKQLVKTKYCDRCPVNKQKPAVATRTFGFDQTWWSMDLCEQHDDMLTRELYSWGLLGEPVEDAPTVRRATFGGNADELRRLADLRAKQTAEDRAITTAPPITLPHDHKDWVFTRHALERIEERETDIVDVLWTCAQPSLRIAAIEPNLVIHERRWPGHRWPLHVVLEPSTKTVVTVAWRAEETRKAIAI